MIIFDENSNKREHTKCLKETPQEKKKNSANIGRDLRRFLQHFKQQLTLRNRQWLH
jgi:hypothetical protein